METQADTEHRELVQTIDKAVKRGALHRNAGARKKSRARGYATADAQLWLSTAPVHLQARLRLHACGARSR